MDVSRYNQITGREALDELLKGVRVYFVSGDEMHYYEIVNNELTCSNRAGGKSTVQLGNFLDVSDTNWYLKKPFDVRKEMLARPYEWVGAYENEQGTWFKVGFDMRSMVAVKTNLPYLRVANFGDTGVSHVAENDLDRCIPIEDVPVYVPNLN